MGGGYSVEQIPSLEGKTAIVTGANTGIGKITSLELARKGCQVVLACRSREKAEPVVEFIKQQTGNELVHFMELDLSSLQSVVQFAQAYKQRDLPIHMLVNNAGIMMCPHKLSTDGIELQFATNHLGSFLLTNLLLDVVVASAPSRIINLSSTAHQYTYAGGVRFDHINDVATYDSIKSYGQSKLCNILFTKQLAQRLQGKQVYVNAVHPGFVATDLQRHIHDTYGSVVAALAGIGSSLFAMSPQQGALTSLYAAASQEVEDNKMTGQYLTPIAKLSVPSGYARDPVLASRLWDFSVDLINQKLGDNILQKEHEQEGHEKEQKEDENKQEA